MNQHIKKIIAVIITFQPDLDLLYRNFLALRTQVAGIVLIDNSENLQQAAQIQALFSAHPELRYVSNNGNLGIAQALNQGVQHAKSIGADWVLTMDQDSVLPENYVASLAEVIQTYDERAISIGTPFVSGDRTFADTEHGGSVKLLITSGNLIQIAAIEKAGMFRDDFFIDYVDIDLSFRLRKLGFQLIETHTVSFSHHLGTPEKKSLLGKTFICTNYSPLRCYYISRNRIVFSRENFLFDPRFVFRCWRDMAKEFLKILLAEDRKGIKVKAIFCGIRDGLLGRMGKYPGKF